MKGDKKEIRMAEHESKGWNARIAITECVAKNGRALYETILSMTAEVSPNDRPIKKVLCDEIVIQHLMGDSRTTTIRRKTIFEKKQVAIDSVRVKMIPEQIGDYHQDAVEAFKALEVALISLKGRGE